VERNQVNHVGAAGGPGLYLVRAAEFGRALGHGGESDPGGPTGRAADAVVGHHDEQCRSRTVLDLLAQHPVPG
jgi:hypothetical protein